MVTRSILMCSAALIIAGGCIESRTNTCSWGMVCPVGYACDEVNQRCYAIAGDCGNGFIDGEEACDGSDLGGKTCQTEGFGTGTLSCDQCQILPDDCRVCGDGVCEPPEDAESCPADCGILDVSVSYSHSCALLVNASLRCWGDNELGQLGRSDVTRSLIAGPVDGAPGATHLAVGKRHTCIASRDGEALCWGDNEYGQLGSGATGSAFTPIPRAVRGLSEVTRICAGSRHTCAVHRTGTVSCWGDNSFGQLGDGTLASRDTPESVVGLDSVLDVSCSNRHTCAVRSDGTVGCWGTGELGELGQGTPESSSVPVEVQGLNDAVAVTAGADHSCAILVDGQAWCWGTDAMGQLGTGGDPGLMCPGGTTCEAAPMGVITIGSVTEISAGDQGTCAITEGGQAWCWGGNLLGDGTLEYAVDPQPVPGVTNATRISSGVDYSCILRSDDSVWCWGFNYDGQLGNDSRDDSLSPVPVQGL